jgi:hypothetical protein
MYNQKEAIPMRTSGLAAPQLQQKIQDLIIIPVCLAPVAAWQAWQRSDFHNVSNSPEWISSFQFYNNFYCHSHGQVYDVSTIDLFL